MIDFILLNGFKFCSSTVFKFNRLYVYNFIKN